MADSITPLQVLQQAREALDIGLRHTSWAASHAHFEGGRKQYGDEADKISAAIASIDACISASLPAAAVPTQQQSEGYPADWARLVLMVSPTGEFHSIGGDAPAGSDPLADVELVGVERLRKRLAALASPAPAAAVQQTESFWIYEMDKGKGVYLGSKDEKVTRQVASEPDGTGAEPGEPFQVYSAAPQSSVPVGVHSGQAAPNAPSAEGCAWRLVPVEPTEQMLSAMAECDGYLPGDRERPGLVRWEDYWRMAISAAPTSRKRPFGGAQ